MRKETRKLVEVVEELIDKYEDYQEWLEEGDKADDPKWDEFRTDWAYEIMRGQGQWRRAGARLFELIRTEDPTRVSGTGVIAEGVEWEDGSASLRWNGKLKSVAHYDRLADIIAIHGHGGSTRVRFR